MKKILTRPSSFIFTGILFLLLSASFCFAGGPFRGDSSQKAKPTVNPPSTNPTVFKTLSKARLTEMVDSLLNLDSIDVKEIE
ncbi:MAG: hypothetical protein IAF38_23075, partial [Bacteroidia bacterium]|nr:hypothetical protein [Bacteroidia bacterium]